MVINIITDYFSFSENNTNLKTETLAGITTFMNMSYIITMPLTFSISDGVGFGIITYYFGDGNIEKIERSWSRRCFT